MKHSTFKALAAVAFLTFAASASADTVKNTAWGIEAGVNFGNMNQTGSTLTSRTGFAAGLNYEYDFTDMFGIRPELSYVQGGAVSGTAASAYDQIMLPINVQGKWGTADFKGIVFVGPTLGYAVNITNGGAPVPANFINTFSIGADFGIGAEYTIASNMSIRVDGRYNLGFSNLNGSAVPAGTAASTTTGIQVMAAFSYWM